MAQATQEQVLKIIQDNSFRIIRSLKDTTTSFEVEDRTVDFEGKADSSLYDPTNWEALAELRGITAEKDLAWKEEVLTLTNPEALTQPGNHLALEGMRIPSYEIQAARGGAFGKNPFYQLAMIGVTRTRDNKILVGIRGGEVNELRIRRFACGLYGLPPGGSVSFPSNLEADPLEVTAIDEFKGELGGDKIDCEYKGLIGVFEATQPLLGPTGIKFVGLVEAKATAEQLIQLNENANATYQILTGQGYDTKAKREIMQERGLPHDAWEHFPLIPVRDNPRSIRSFIDSQPGAHAPIGIGALELYLQSL
ncbi:MAG: hypothetical protein ABIJ18_01970 [archaeon]